MSFHIAIPSLGRAQSLKMKTMSYLGRTDVLSLANGVDVFLSDGSERDEYEKTLDGLPVRFIVTEQKHVNTQRNFIVDYYKEGENILGIDDDIESVRYKVTSKKTTEVVRLTEFVETAFDICKANEVDIWGVNPVLNPFFMKENVSFNLKYIPAGFYGWVNSRSKKAYVSTKPEYGKEDFERSIKYYMDDGGVARFNYVAMKTKYYAGTGGIQTYRTVESEEKAVRWLLDTFPSYCRRNTGKKGKYPEVRLVDKRKKKDAQAH
jgi:hypothetical protein